MTGNVKKMTRSALAAALGFTLLYSASVIPTARIAVTAAAGITVAAVFISCGLTCGAAVFLITALLGILFLPLKSPAVLYICLLGYYPLAKSFFERIRNPVVVWIAKLFLFNAVFTGLFIFSSELLNAELKEWQGVHIAARFAGNTAFILYDICFSKIIHLYISRFSKYF